MSTQLHIGFKRDDRDGVRTEVTLNPKSLLRHVMALGSSGSGKTVFSKVIVEEMTRLGLPAICIDPQGDICSLAMAIESGDEKRLAERGVSLELAQAWREQVEVVIYTPASRRGVPICADPFNSDPTELPARERLHAISAAASMLVTLLGFDLSSDHGEGLMAAFDATLTGWAEQGKYPRTLEAFSTELVHLEGVELERLSRFVDDKKLKTALRKLARLEIGTRRLLFHEGLPLSINLLLGRGSDTGAVEGKTRLSVIYLNTLHSAEDKEFLIASIADQLYGWMLKNPSKTPQALFYIDEVAPFIPPVRKTACKDSLMLIFKQARKYGLCCLMATQNPGDVDYKAMAQFGTWVIGRLTTRQDLKKVQPTLKSLDPNRVDELMEMLPTLQAGEFVLISPDQFSESIDLKVRWLYSKHETLDEQMIEHLCDERWRTRFEAVEDLINQKDTKGSHPPVFKHDQSTDIERLDKVQASSATLPVRESEMDSEIVEKASKNTKPKSHSQTPALKTEDDLENLEDEDDVDDVDETDVAEKYEPLLSVLAEYHSVSSKEISQRLSISESKARSQLKSLYDQGILKSFKQGRSVHYYHPQQGARPDLGLGNLVDVLLSKLTDRELEACIEVERRKNSFISFSNVEERSLGYEKIYYVLYRVIFSEKVADGFFERWTGQKSAQIDESIYLEPGTLKVLVYQPNKPIILADQPSQTASEIDDFDGVAELSQLAPASVQLDEEAWQKRRDESLVKDSINRRFDVSIREIKPILLPLWKVRYQHLEKGHERVLYLDGITGQRISF